MGTAEEGEGGRNRDSGTNIYTLPCEEWTASGKLPDSTGSPARHPVMT